MSLIRSTVDDLCPNMIHFDALGFKVSVGRSKEVLSFFWRSMYMCTN